MTPIETRVTEPIIVLTPSQLRAEISYAIEKAVEALREDLRNGKNDLAPQVISGKEEIMKFLGVRNEETFRKRRKDYPSAFSQAGKKTILLNVPRYQELLASESKMSRK